MPTIADGARGFGALVASADTDGPIRRVPLLVLTGETALRPGLAVEAVRLAQDAGSVAHDVRPAANRVLYRCRLAAISNC